MFKILKKFGKSDEVVSNVVNLHFFRLVFARKIKMIFSVDFRSKNLDDFARFCVRFVGPMSRETASEVLENHDNGTYLVRENLNHLHYAISIR